jgi:hypothetical protein
LPAACDFKIKIQFSGQRHDIPGHLIQLPGDPGCLGGSNLKIVQSAHLK